MAGTRISFPRPDACPIRVTFPTEMDAVAVGDLHRTSAFPGILEEELCARALPGWQPPRGP